MYITLVNVKTNKEIATARVRSIPPLGAMVTVPDLPGRFVVRQVLYNYMSEGVGDLIEESIFVGILKAGEYTDQTESNTVFAVDLARDPHGQQAAKVYADSIERTKPDQANALRQKIANARTIYKKSLDK